MRASRQRAALRATARIAFGSSAARALLGSGALGFGLASCGGQMLDHEHGGAEKPQADGGGRSSSAGGGATSSAGASALGGVSGSTGAAGTGTGGAGTSGGSVSESASGVAGLHAGASGGGGSGGDPTGEGLGGGGGSSEPDPVCVGPTMLERPPATPGPSEQEFNCCFDVVSNAAQNSSSPEGQELLGSERIVNCCRAIVTAVDIDHSRYSTASRVRTACCSARVAELTELYQHQLCTPWGPPMPPALDWEAA